MVDQPNRWEIEAKYLVRGEDWRDLAPGILTRQGYLSSDRKDRSIRVRIQVIASNRVGFLAHASIISLVRKGSASPR